MPFKDINECILQTDTCSKKAECINLLGSFKCRCFAGFRGDGYICSDIDECSEDIHECEWNKLCQNTIGSFNCVCPPGFQMTNRECIGK